MVRRKFLISILAIASGVFAQAPRFADESFSRGLGHTPHILTIAHRGGVTGHGRPECSEAAMREAIRQGFDMVELDLQGSIDDVPFVFHDATLNKATDHKGVVSAHASDNLRGMFYRGTEEALMPLDAAVRVAAEAIGLMLEIKGSGHSEEFYQNILADLEQNGVSAHAMVFPSNPETRKAFAGKIRMQLPASDVTRVLPSLPQAAHAYFVFGLPADLRKMPVVELRRKGVPVIAAINTFRYKPASHQQQARRDVEAMLDLGVDGFQIDSVYYDMLQEELTKRGMK